MSTKTDQLCHELYDSMVAGTKNSSAEILAKLLETIKEETEI